MLNIGAIGSPTFWTVNMRVCTTTQEKRIFPNWSHDFHTMLGDIATKIPARDTIVSPSGVLNKDRE